MKNSASEPVADPGKGAGARPSSVLEQTIETRPPTPYPLPLIAHFTVMGGREADVDLVLIQTFLPYNVTQVILILSSILQGQFS